MAWRPSSDDASFGCESALLQLSGQLDAGLRQTGSSILRLALSSAGVRSVFGLPQALNLAYYSSKVLLAR